jgi:hypothetical protein
MIIRIILSLIILPILMCSAYAEKIDVKKITLAHFKIKDGSIINLPKTSPYWPEVDRHILTVDDLGNIYILNLWNNEILIYDKYGKLQRTVIIKEILSRDKYINGNIEVSGDGKRIFVEGYDHFQKSAQFILDQDGNIVKRLTKNDFIWNIPDRRLCDNPFYLFEKGRLIYNNEFKLLEDKFNGFNDSEGKYKYGEKHALIKIAKDGKNIWVNHFYGNFGIIGVDRNDYIYIEGRLRKGDRNSLYKLSSKGEILAQVRIPNPFPFLTKEEQEDWDMHASEEFLSFFKLTCNGDVYLIYQLGELPKRTFQRWLKGGEYFIYKFETKK